MASNAFGLHPRSRRPVRGSTFGLLVVVQSLGNLGASVIAGLLWTTLSSSGPPSAPLDHPQLLWTTTLSPSRAFAYLAAWMAVALLALIATDRSATD